MLRRGTLPAATVMLARYGPRLGQPSLLSPTHDIDYYVSVLHYIIHYTLLYDNLTYYDIIYDLQHDILCQGVVVSHRSLWHSVLCYGRGGKSPERGLPLSSSCALRLCETLPKKTQSDTSIQLDTNNTDTNNRQTPPMNTTTHPTRKIWKARVLASRPPRDYCGRRRTSGGPHAERETASHSCLDMLGHERNWPEYVFRSRSDGQTWDIQVGIFLLS